MKSEKKEHPKEKSKIHPRNKHRERYDFKKLIVASKELQAFVKLNEYGDESIDFFNPDAVKALNKALLKYFYRINYWDIPQNYLCPPIPGRADYIHHISDLLASINNNKIPTGEKIKVIDIGVGANCVYPIIGTTEYGWKFVGSEIDKVALESAQKIVQENPSLQGKIQLRWQTHDKKNFGGIIEKGEYFDLSICNPPFHASAQEAQAGTIRKLSSLKKQRVTKVEQNFGGQSNELWCVGGERRFVENMIRESRQFGSHVLWFSAIISKSAHLQEIYDCLKIAEVAEHRTIEMGQGQKVSRIVAWTFHNAADQKKWAEKYWK